MRRISYYVAAVVFAGLAITAFWVYDRYFKAAEQPFLYFTVDRGDIQEAVKVRSEVVAEKEFELEFPFSGTVQNIYVKDGETVTAGERLMSFDSADLAIEANQLKAVVAQRQAELAKLKSGATSEEIKVSQSQLASAQTALEEARTNLIDKLRDAYTKSDDALRAKADELFDNPLSAAPTLKNDIITGAATRDALDAERPQLGVLLMSWSAAVNALATSSDLVGATGLAKQNLSRISAFLNTLSPVVSNITETATLSQAIIDKYKTDLSAARTGINTASASVAAAEEKYNLADSDVALAEEELAYTEAPARPEDIAIASARVTEAQEQLAAIQDQIRRATLVAPTDGKISKVRYEVGEVFRPGSSAISMVTAGFKLQSDVSELDIAKVRDSDGSGVRITLDAFPGKVFTGKVVSIDPEAVTKTEDKYYRVNTIFDAQDAPVRSGMSADATILGTARSQVLRIPQIALYTDRDLTYLKLLKPGLAKATSDDSFERVEVETGISDGDYVEIVNGATEGQTAVVTAD